MCVEVTVKNSKIINRDLIQVKKRRFSLNPFSFNKKKADVRFLLVTEEKKGSFETTLFDLVYENGELQNFKLDAKDINKAKANHNSIIQTIKWLVRETKDLNYRNFKNYLSVL